MGRKRSCQPLSCRCSLNVMHCRKEQEAPKKEICWICLSKESVPTILYGISNHPLSTRSRFLRATVRSTSSALCLHHALPFVVASDKGTCLMRRSKAFGHAVAVSKTCYKLQCCDCALSCAMRLLQTNEPLSGFSFSAKVGWERSCQPLSCGCSVNVIHCPKRFVGHCSSKESVPTILYGISNHPLSTRSRFLRATVRSTSSALCLHHALPFVVAAEKRTCFMQRSKAFGHGDLLAVFV